jgi:AhpC/TSA family
LRVPPDVQIVAPEFPPGLEWVNVAFLRMDKLLGRGAVLLEFWDFARVNSLRTLPYLKGWHARYAGAGLRVIGVHSPGYSFGRDPEVARAAIERLEVPFPVVLDPELTVWRTYGNKGWPGRYLFDHRGVLRHIHYGEGEYRDTEEALQEALAEAGGEREWQAPLEPLRPEDAPGVLLEPQSADVVLPAERDELELVRDWTDGEDYIEARDTGAAARVAFEGGAAFAVLSGTCFPGLYETDGQVVAEAPGLRLHGFQFVPRPPGASGRP